MNYLKNKKRVDKMGNKIEIEKIKDISIEKVLTNFGISPVKRNEKEGWYLAWERKEKTPSLKVNYHLNRFYDHGSGESGSVIDVVMLLKGFEFREALEYLNEFDTSSFIEWRIENISESLSKSAMTISKITELTHPALIEYTKSRGIENSLISQYCQQVHYSVGERSYFAIGFKNEKGGFELRSKIFKNCTSPKWYSHIKNGNGHLYIFEGVFDLISWLTANQNARREKDYLVLNSVALIKKVPLEILREYSHIYLFMDNDSAGKNATNYFLSSLKNATDCSPLYEPFKDVNEWLMSRDNVNLKNE